MVGEDEIGREVTAELRGIELDVALQLRPAQILEQACFQSLVTIEHEHRQERPDLGPNQRRPTDVVALGVALLAEEDNLVSGVAPLPCERACVDVGARPAEQIAVPEKNAHRAQITCKKP